MLLSADATDLNSLKWDELVSLKRKLSMELRGLTEKIIEIDRKKVGIITNGIRSEKSAIDLHAQRLKQIHSEVDKLNSELFAVSEKISQSKNFLSIMGTRLPSETENQLYDTIKKNQALLDAKDYNSQREKQEHLSRLNDATMKLEAIKAARATEEQLSELTVESAKIGSAISRLDDERNLHRKKISEINGALDKWFDEKRSLEPQRAVYVGRYAEIVKQFDAINARLDAMSEIRRRHREHGYYVPSDQLLTMKEEARKKLETGSKLSFEELKLLFDEID